MSGRLLDLVEKAGDRSGREMSLAVIRIISIMVVKIMEWNFLKENILTETKRVHHFYGTEKGSVAFEKIMVSNGYVPVSVLSGGGTKMIGIQILFWKLPI